MTDWPGYQVQLHADAPTRADLLADLQAGRRVDVQGRQVVLAWPGERIVVWADTRTPYRSPGRHTQRDTRRGGPVTLPPGPTSPTAQDDHPMTTPDDLLAAAQALADLALALGDVHRATLTPDGRPESDTTHTCMVGLVAVGLAHHADVPLNLGLVAMYALVHDLVEAYAGDTNTAQGLTDQQAADKAAREAAALARLRLDLAATPVLVDLIDSYERQLAPEARWVRYLDKVAPKLTHRRNGCAAVRRLGMGLGDVQRSHHLQGDALRRCYPDLPTAGRLFDAAAAACEAAYLEHDHADD